MPEVVPEKPEVHSFIPADYDYWNDQLLQDAMNFVYGWYESTLPRFLDSAGFISFAIRSRELAKRISPKTPMELTKRSSAWTDGEKLYLPTGYLLPAFYRSMGIPREDDSVAAIAAINGSQIHEALHCSLGLFNWRRVADEYARDQKGLLSQDSRERISSHELAKVQNIKGFNICLNLIADVAIEAACEEIYPILYDFVICKNELLLGNRMIPYAIESLAEDSKIDNTLETLFLTKNVNSAELLKTEQPNLEKYINIIEKARNSDAANYADVINIGYELYKALVNGEDSSGQEFSESSSDSDEMKPDTTSSMEKAMMRAIISALTNGEIDMDGGELGDSDPKSSEKGDKNEAEIERIVQSFDKEMDKEKDKDSPPVKIDYKALGDVGKNIREVHLVDINEWHGLTASPLDPVTKWKSFGNYLKYARHETKNRGVAKDHGRRLLKHRLSHLITDQKLFITPTDVGTKRGQPEVIILVDVSGSMHSGRVQNDSGRYVNLLTAVVNASHGMHISLMNASIRNIVVAHTTSNSLPGAQSHGPIMYGIAAYDMPFFSSYSRTTGDTAVRFGKALNIDCNENYDGIAVQKAGTLFTSSLSTKVLIVLSDGQPSAPYYSGSSALNHAKDSATLVRKKGIAVISMSLTEGVMDTNNAIYGKKNNIAAYGANFNKAMTGIVQMIAESNKE